MADISRRREHRQGALHAGPRLRVRRLRDAVRLPRRDRRHRAALGPTPIDSPEVWRDKQLEYTWTLTLAGRYVDFWTLTQRALDFAFARFPSVDTALAPTLLDAYLKLDAFPDARAVLRALKAQGVRTAILSNGSPNMLDGAVDGRTRSAATSTPCSRSTRSASTSRARRSMRWSPSAFCSHRAEIIFVSSNRWDVMGATAFGFRCIWVNRAGLPDEYPEFAPVAVVRDLASLAMLA